MGFTVYQGSLGLNFITGKLIPFLVSGALFILITTTLIFLVIGGIMWITSGGDKEGLAKAKSAITYALLGLVLGLGSFIILGILGNFFGVNLLGNCLVGNVALPGIICIVFGW